MLIGGMPAFYTSWVYTLSGFGIRTDPRQANLAWVPNSFVPDKKIVDLVWSGGVPVPWGELSQFIFNGFLMYTLIGFMGVFFIMIFRRLIIDVQKLPFPYARPAIEIIQAGMGEEGLKGLQQFFKSKLLWAGFIIGFLFYAPYLVNAVAPGAIWVPGTLDWGGGYVVNIMPTTTWVLPMVMGIFWWNPELILLAYLCPMDVLATGAWAWFGQYWILPIIEDFAGITPKAPPGFKGGSGWGVSWYYAMVEGIKPGFIFESGVLYGLAVFTFVFNWKYIKGTLVSAFKGSQAPEERLEPVSYRTMWIGFIICFILLYLVDVAILGTNAVVTLFGLIIFVLVLFSSTLCKAEQGYNIWWLGYPSSDFIQTFGMISGQWRWPLAKGAPSDAFLTNQVLSVWHFGYPMTNHAMPYAAEGFKVASVARARARDVFVGLIIVIPLVILLGNVLSVWVSYTYGINRGIVAWKPTGWVFEGVYANTAAFWPPNDWQWQVLVGFVATPFLMLARIKFPWFWIHPVGLIIVSGQQVKIGTALFPAWIMKFVVMKLGGTKLFERTVPFVVGFPVGCVLCRILAGAVGAYFRLMALA
jgi:hypothetical protein